METKHQTGQQFTISNSGSVSVPTSKRWIVFVNEAGEKIELTFDDVRALHELRKADIEVPALR